MASFSLRDHITGSNPVLTTQIVQSSEHRKSALNPGSGDLSKLGCLTKQKGLVAHGIHKNIYAEATLGYIFALTHTYTKKHTYEQDSSFN
jgi:hypothetical protein